MFSLRIVNVDSYQSVPTKGYDICYSEFRGSEIFKVPIIRIFGITPAGQKGCLHVHGVFPYFSIRCRDVFPNVEAKSLRKYMQELAIDIDKALNVASRNSNSHRQHVYKIVITEHIPFYGFHEKAEEFLKIYFYNPFDVSRTAELMTNGVILNKFIQPYEAHIPYILQFFIDYNLFGMNLIHVSKFKFRASEDDLVSAISPLRNQSLSRLLDESTCTSNKVWNIGTLSSSQISSLPRQTLSELEADCSSSEIMNRLNESFSSGQNPGLLAIWEEERQRRKAENDTSLITPVPSQERTDFIETESENFYKKKLRKILESLDVYKICQKEKLDHAAKDMDNASSPSVLDLSSSQDEDMLNLMLSLASSQSTQLDEDSILGLQHNEEGDVAGDDETLEMSQLFTGELEKMWSQAVTGSDDATSAAHPREEEQSPMSNENVTIPQLDGAFDDQDFKTSKPTKKTVKKPIRDLSEESLIKSCTLYQPVVQLSPTLIIKEEVLSSPLESIRHHGSDDASKGRKKEVPSKDSHGSSIPVCVPVSRNPHCSLIMNFCEDSNDVSIEHTCDSRGSAQMESLVDAEDPSNVVFEILTNLVYKVECLTEGRTSCYEHLTEEYRGKSYSEMLYQDLNTEEKNAVSQIKAAASDYEEKSFTVKKDSFSELRFSLPIKKRIFRSDQCDSCSHSSSMDFSKIGKEVVVLRKLSESDFRKNVNFNSLKVVIPPLPLHSVVKLTGSIKVENGCHFKPTSPVSSDLKKEPEMGVDQTPESENFSCDNKIDVNNVNPSKEEDSAAKHELPAVLSPPEDIIQNNSKPDSTATPQSVSVSPSEGIQSKVKSMNDNENVDDSIASSSKCAESSDMEISDDAADSDFEMLSDSAGDEVSKLKEPSPKISQKSDVQEVNAPNNYSHNCEEQRTDAGDNRVHSGSDDIDTSSPNPVVTTDSKIRPSMTNLKITFDSSKSKTTPDNTHRKITFDYPSSPILHSPDSETAKVEETSSSEKKTFATMSELRLYRRKRSTFKRGEQDPSHHPGDNVPPPSLGFEAQEENSYPDVKIKTINPASFESGTTCIMPVVQLEPCKDLIEKYCKNETCADNDCLILGEVNRGSKMTPVPREKRFFRSRARQLRDQSLSSKVVINHTIGLGGSKFKSNKFALNRRGQHVTMSHSKNQSASGPTLRKRSANQESQDKKKLSHSNFKPTSKKNSREEVYDFESHLNDDVHDLENTSFSRYSLENKSFVSTLKKDVSGKLSLKLNRKKINIAQIISEAVADVSSNSDVQPQSSPHLPTRTRPTRRASTTVISYNEDHFQTQDDLTKKFKSHAHKSPTNENLPPLNSGPVADSNYSWSIDDIPISQLKSSQGLKCTISKKRLNNGNNLQEVERLPIPKFKVRKKLHSGSLNVSIKIKRMSSDFLNNDSDFKVKKKSLYRSSKKVHKKSSKRNSQAFASALDVKHKYKKHKETKKESLKNAIWQFCNSPRYKNPNAAMSSLHYSNQEANLWKKKFEFCKPNSPILSSYNSASTSKDETSDVSNSSPLTAEDNSDDSKRSKSSLKMKLKIKRILTRSNEERIVVVGKELEGLDADSDEEENKQASADELTDRQAELDPPKSHKKVLGIRGIHNQADNHKLTSKFKCPLVIESKKIEKCVEAVKKSNHEEKNEFKAKIPKFRYKPLLANISKDLLSETVCNSVTTALHNNVSPKKEHSLNVISPKKKSPLKNAELIKKELAFLKEMVSAADNEEDFRRDVKKINKENADNFKNTESLNEEKEKDELLNDGHLSPKSGKLRDRKQSTSSKAPSRRNSLRCQDFKKYFDSDNEDSTRNSNELVSSDINYPEKPELLDPEFDAACKPCTVQIPKLSTFDVENYVHKKLFKLHHSEKMPPCDSLVASFPSPVVDSKSADSYIDPKKVFENLFEFSSPSQSPVNYNPFEASNLIIENEASVGPFSSESSEHSRKEIPKPTFNPVYPLKPKEVFKSVERSDMGVLWNLAYFSPPQLTASEKYPLSPSSQVRGKNSTHIVGRKENSEELDDLQKLASRVNQLCSLSHNLMESEGENSMSMQGERSNVKNKLGTSEVKTSFKNILEGNSSTVFDNPQSVPSYNGTLTESEPFSNRSENSEFACTNEEIAQVIKEEPKSDQDPVFVEPAESLPNVRILDFQECLVESDSEMNPLLNDSEIDSVMSSADMILSNSVDNKLNYEQSLPAELSFEDSSLSLQNKLKCASEEPIDNKVEDDDALIKDNTDSDLQKELDTDLTCNDAIITAADTSSLFIPSYKNNTIPVLAINNPNQESISLTAFEEQNFNGDGQFFPVVIAPVAVTDNANYLDNSSVAVKEAPPGPPECVDFLEDNELLQSCSVSSTSDIENKTTQAANALGIPFNGEEDILSMIVKSCDIGEEFDVNMNSAEETEGADISSAPLCDNLVDSNYVVPASNFIISTQPDQNAFQTSSENAVSSSSENNLAPKNAEIVVIKTEPADIEQIMYEFQDKSHNVSRTGENAKAAIVEKEDSVLLDSMIHSFYGDDSIYGLHSSTNSENLSLLCPTFQSSNSVIKAEDVAVEACSYKSDNYAKNISAPQAKVIKENDSLPFKNYTVNNVPLGIVPNSFLVAQSFPKISSKRYHFIPCSRPPPRDLIEASLIKSEAKRDVNLSGDDSQGSDSSLSSSVSPQKSASPNVFNKTLSSDVEGHGSQSSASVTKMIPHHDRKGVDSPVLHQERNVSNLSFATHMMSTPSTSSIKREFPLASVVVSPINKEPTLTADTNKRKRKLIFEGDSEGLPKMLRAGTDKAFNRINSFARNNPLNQSGDSLGNLSFSQIDGPTLENSRGFKVGSDNFGDAGVRHEVQHLTVMSLEIHVNTRNDLRPDPKFDPVTAIFYCIYNDIGVREEEEIIGMIVVDPVSHHQTCGQNSSETLKNYLLLCPGVKNGFIYCVENELSLFEKLIRVIREWDPDILIGYEIQMSSWGYLIERAELLNINLRTLLSRLVDKNEPKFLPVEQDLTVTDQTADLSRLNIIGRIVLCVWRLMRKEVTLNVYSFENVYYHVLHKRTPLYAFHDLTNWFLGSQKERVIRYYVIRVQGSVHLLEKLDVIGRTSELARLFGIQFYEVLSRGSQFRVESMMLRTAAPMSYIPVSPSVRQRSHSRAPECVPLILEPESRFYIDPVVVLDFQSLYPSMIIAYNYCFSTCLGRVEHFGKNVPFEFGCTSLSIPTTLLQKLQNDIHISPTGIAFVKSSMRRGILPSMLEEILNTRVMVKQSMKKIKDKNALRRLLDARQMGLKLIANVTYGYTGASFSGRMPSVEVADSIVGKARETLERAIHMIENTSKWRAKVIYGDTDSLFILLPGRSKKQAFEIGQEIADAVTADNPKPVKLKFEKVYLPCVLQTKKRYVGFMYETVDQESPVFDAKGIETVRRDSCPATGKILEKSLKILFKTYDVNLVKTYVQKQYSKLLSGQASIIDCIFAKEYRGISGYRPGACVPALEIAKKRLSKDPRSEPRVGERVPYVVVYGFPGLPIIQLVREPLELLRDHSLRINASYYITRVVSPPLERVFNLLGADVKAWYSTLGRTFKPTLPMSRPPHQQHRGTLSQYFVTLSCPSCEKPTFTAVCDDCREDLQGTTIALNEKIRQWERTLDHLTQICGSCTKSSGSTDSCVSLDCPMLFKLSAAKKDLSQAPYLRKVLAHELF